MHPKLILSLNGDTISEIDLDKESTTIGRKAVNDIQVDNLAVSGTHAKVLALGRDCFLEDMESTNGTYVNGDRVTKHVLKHGDKIMIGKHQLLYQNEAAANADDDEEDFEKTMILKPYAPGVGDAPPTKDVAPAPESEKPSESGAQVSATQANDSQESSSEESSATEGATFKAALQLLSGANVGKRLILTKPLTRLGKPGAQVAAIQMRANGCYVFNVPGSGKAPSLNGKDIGAKAALLKNGDVLEIGAVRMKYVQF